MPSWDDNRDFRQDRERRQGRNRDVERRSFEDERGRFNSDEARYGEREPWRPERYGSRYDEDRGVYGAGYSPGRREYGRGAAEPLSYGGQEYGIEGHGAGGGYGGGGGFESRRAQTSAYSAPRQAHPDEELDPEYCRWRDEQMSNHDRDYQEWRLHQHRQYDEDYRKFRHERREQFGRTFQDWRSQRTAVGGVPDTAIAAGQSGYGESVAIPGGNYLHATDRPTGAHDAAPGHLSADPAMQQTGGSASGAANAGPRPAPTGGGAEFDAEPAQVKAAAGGNDPRRDTDKERDKDARH